MKKMLQYSMIFSIYRGKVLEEWEKIFRKKDSK